MSIATFPPPSLAAQLAELKREKAMRARVYPHWISTGKIQKHTADYNNRGLDGAIATLEAILLAPVTDTVADVLKRLGT